MVVAVPRRFIRDTDGVSAIELALIAPFVLAMLLLMTDLGFAIHQRMAMNYILRLGGEAAMMGAYDEEIAETLNQAVIDHATTRMEDLDIKPPARVCRCSGADDIEVSCTQPCPNDGAMDIYVELSAEMPYRSILMGDTLNITLRSELQVQILADL